MANRTGYRQMYSATGINSPSAGRTGQTAQGRFTGSTQGFTDPNSGKVSRNGQLLSRRKRYYAVRTGLGLSGG